jgi:hypothetical protein
MGDSKKLLKEFKEEFEKFKKNNNLIVSFEELEENFSIGEEILSRGHIPNNISSFICNIIIEHYKKWENSLNNLLMPQQNNYVNQVEYKIFNNELDRDLIWGLIKKINLFNSEYSLLDLKKDETSKIKFIDSSFKIYRDEFKQKLLEIFSRIHKAWSLD